MTLKSYITNSFTAAPLGTVSACLEMITFILMMFCFSTLGSILNKRLLPFPDWYLYRGLLILYLCSVPISVVGLVLDNKKSVAAFVLISIVPCFMLIGMWAGYW